MIQRAQSESVSASGASVDARLSGLLAARVINGIERGETKDEVVDAIVSIQDGIHEVCQACGARWPVRFISRSYARRLYNLARSAPIPDLVDALERHLRGQAPVCPRCGYVSDEPGRQTVN